MTSGHQAQLITTTLELQDADESLALAARVGDLGAVTRALDNVTRTLRRVKETVSEAVWRERQ